MARTISISIYLFLWDHDGTEKVICNKYTRIIYECSQYIRNITFDKDYSNVHNTLIRNITFDKDLAVCTVTSTLEIKLSTHLWVVGKNCVKVLSISVKGLRSYAPYKVDGQTGWFLYTPNFVCWRGGLYNNLWKDMTWDIDTYSGHGQHVCEILSRSNIAVKSYGPETDFWYVTSVNSTLEIWPWLKVMTNPKTMDNNHVKYYPDPTLQ